MFQVEGPRQRAETGQQRPSALLYRLATRLHIDPAVLTDERADAQFGPLWRRTSPRFKPYGRLMFALWGNRFIWVGLGTQVLLGLALLAFMAWRWLPELHGWWPVLVPAIMGLGGLAGWNISRRVAIYWTATGGSFSFPGLWRALLFLIPLMILRFGLTALVNHGHTTLLPLRNLLFFFVPGMLTTRATVLIVRLRDLQRTFVKDRLAEHG